MPNWPRVTFSSTPSLLDFCANRNWVTRATTPDWSRPMTEICANVFTFSAWKRFWFRAKRWAAPALNELVDEVLEKFLAAAPVRRHVALAEHIGLEFLHRGFAGFNAGADAGIPRGIALPHKFRQPPVLADGDGNFEPAREGVHAADVRVKEVHGFETFAANLRVEIDAAGGKAAVLQHRKHRVGRQVNAGRELV